MNVKLLLFMPALMLLLSGGSISNAERSNPLFFGDLPTIKTLNNNDSTADSEEEFICNVGGIFTSVHQTFYTHCCPDIVYKLTYLGPTNSQTRWSIFTPQGSNSFVNGSNRFSRVAYVRFVGCNNMNIAVRVTCPNGSVTNRIKSITHNCC